MKALNLTKTVVRASLIAAGLAMAQSSFASPDDGAQCRNEFNAEFRNGLLKCTKQVVTKRDYTCPSNFPTYRVRNNGQRDICLADGVDIGSADSLEGFENGTARICFRQGAILPPRLGGRPVVTNPAGLRCVTVQRGGDFIFVDEAPNVNSLAAVVSQAVEIAFERNNNLRSNEVDGNVLSKRNIVDGGNGSKDQLEVTTILFTFPVLNTN